MNNPLQPRPLGAAINSKTSPEAAAINAVLFDLDGTLVDSAPDLAVALNLLRAQENLEDLPYAEIRAQVSNGGNALVELGFGVKVGQPRQAELRQRLLDLYELNIGRNSQLFTGLDELLAELEQQQIPWGIVTNKPRLYTDLLLQELGIQAPAVVCPDDLGISKPNPEPLLLGAQKLGVPATECLYVGDHQRDIEAGQRAGMRTLAVSFGYLDNTSDPATWGADALVASVAEHNAYIKNLLGF